MTVSGWAMILLFTVLFVALAKPMGAWLYALYSGQNIPGVRMLAPVERGFYQIAGVDPAREQTWVGYATALVTFNVAGMVLLFAILKLQGGLPLNPQGFEGMESWLAFTPAAFRPAHRKDLPRRARAHDQVRFGQLTTRWATNPCWP